MKHGHIYPMLDPSRGIYYAVTSGELVGRASGIDDAAKPRGTAGP